MSLTVAQQDFLLDWETALLSDEYEQAHGALRVHKPDGDQFCCIGVACVVAGFERAAEAENRAEVLDDVGELAGYSIQGSNQYSRIPSVSWEQLTGLHGLVQQQLISLNDAGASFRAIAAALSLAVNHGPYADGTIKNDVW